MGGSYWIRQNFVGAQYLFLRLFLISMGAGHQSAARFLFGQRYGVFFELSKIRWERSTKIREGYEYDFSAETGRFRTPFSAYFEVSDLSSTGHFVDLAKIYKFMAAPSAESQKRTSERPCTRSGTSPAVAQLTRGKLFPIRGP